MKLSPLMLAGTLLFAPFLSAQGTSSKTYTNADVKGSFPFNETIHIVQQPAVNGACGTSLSGPVTTAIINDTGTWTFDGKGNMSIVDQGVEITSNPPTDASQVVGAAAICSGTYNLLPKGILDLHYNCSLDHFVSYFQVHSLGKITPYNILITTVNNPDGTPGVTPYIYGSSVVGCSNVVENTVVSINLDLGSTLGAP